MTDYPFITMGPRSRLVRVTAQKFSNALSRVLSLHPNKFLKTQFAKRMDLISANEKALALSKKSAHKQYVVLEKSGDFEVENALSLEDSMDVYCIFHKGKKIEGPEIKNPEPEEQKAGNLKKNVTKSTKEVTQEVSKSNKQTKKEEIMGTKAKKSVKKVVAKKAAKKPANVKKIEGAKIVSISIKEMRANIKKGMRYYDPQGVSQNEKGLAARGNQDYVREGMQELKVVK
jgi:hypothetical protein